MYKQHQVVLVATDKAENALILYQGVGSKTLKHEPSYLTQEYLQNIYAKSFHLYILSEEEIEVGDWYLTFLNNEVIGKPRKCEDSNWNFSSCKKIIASTDKSLVIDIIPTGFKSGVGALSHKQTKSIPQIHQSFIEYFITEFNKGNVIDKVNVEYRCLMSAKAQMIDFGNNSVTDLTESECIQSELMIDEDNCINIKPIKESWSRDELQFMKGSTTNHIEWIYERLINVHKENPNYDYMLKLKEISNFIKENL